MPRSGNGQNSIEEPTGGWIPEILRHPRVLSKSISPPRKKPSENSAMRLPTKTPKVNRSREYRAGENGFRSSAPRSDSPTATTLENNEKFRQSERAEKRFAGGLAEERELGSNSLWGVNH